MERTIDQVYYIKENGITRRVTKEEYKTFVKKNKPLCPNCNQSYCEKHKTKESDISKCESISDGSYNALVKEKTERYCVYGEEKRTTTIYRDEIYSQAYKCSEYKPDKEYLATMQKTTAESIISLESKKMTMLELIISKESESEKDELRNEVIEVIRQIDELEKQVTLKKVVDYLYDRLRTMKKAYKMKNGNDKYEQIKIEEGYIGEIIENARKKEAQDKSIELRFSSDNNDQK